MSSPNIPAVIITGIETQPTFPVDDLSEVNAQMLELMLQSPALLQEGHTGTEWLSSAYRVGHPTVVEMGDEVYHDASVQAAMNHGVMLVETAAMLVTTESHSTTPALLNEVVLLRRHLEKQAGMYVIELVERLQNEMPRFYTVVLEASKRTDYRYKSQYVAAGAALTRELVVKGALPLQS